VPQQHPGQERGLADAVAGADRKPAVALLQRHQGAPLPGIRHRAEHLLHELERPALEPLDGIGERVLDRAELRRGEDVTHQPIALR